MTRTRQMERDDLSWILGLNQIHQVELSPLTAPELADMVDNAFLAHVAEPEAGFLLTFHQDAVYDSPNFLWFKAKYDRFVYVDRIAIAEAHQRKGLAQALYRDLFDAARAFGHDRVCCEVNAMPPNPASDRFHAALGFHEVGSAHLADRNKQVTYFAARLE